jgi:hypothetical protein
MMQQTIPLWVLSLLFIILSSTLLTQRTLYSNSDGEFFSSSFSKEFQVSDKSKNNIANALKNAFFDPFQSQSSNFITTAESTFDAADVDNLNRRNLKEGNRLGSFFGNRLAKKSNEQIKEKIERNRDQMLSDNNTKTMKSGSAPVAIKQTVNRFYSPSNGTDVISHPIAVIKCLNQTMCIQPKLQLTNSYNVYFCKHVGHGVRFYFLAKEGLLLHPNINMIEDIDKADSIVYLPVSAPWHKSECNKPEYKNKTIVLDEGDGPQLFEPDGSEEYKKTDWLLYFKRSYVRRHNGQFKGYMGYVTNTNVLPMTYTVVEAYVKTAFNMMRDRNLDIVCTLRGSNGDPTRLRVRQWVEEYAKARGVQKYVAGQVNHASRTVVDRDYLGQMFRAKIIVTSNPSDWEGDFRLMEAMASGALIFVDQMYVPRPYPLIEGKHIVYYGNI